LLASVHEKLSWDSHPELTPPSLLPPQLLAPKHLTSPSRVRNSGEEVLGVGTGLGLAWIETRSGFRGDSMPLLTKCLTSFARATFACDEDTLVSVPVPQ
jgi:hypothetical protein